MSRISDSKVQQLKEYRRQQFPDAEIVYKEDIDELPTWWLKALFWFVGLAGEEIERAFWEDFGQGLYGYILLPFSEDDMDLHNPYHYGFVRHELVHLRDCQRFGILWGLAYLLPPLFLTFRAPLEVRAYAQEMIEEYERHGHVSRDTIDNITEYLSGSTYGWAFFLEKTLRTRLEGIARKIELEEISGFYPAIGWFDKLVRPLI